MCVDQFNILYLYSSVIDPLKGGVQSVTYELSNYFVSKNCCCYYLSKDKIDSDNKMQFCLPDSSRFYNKVNIEFLLEFIKDKKINILINQGGISYDCSLLAYTVKAYGVKVISCIHNSLLDTVRNYDILYYNKYKKYKLQKLLSLTKINCVKYVLYKLYHFKYAKHYKNLYENSDKIVLLSDSFKKDLSFFVGDLSDKVCSIPNPLPTKISDIIMDGVKENIVLYVGRVDSIHKKTDLLLNIWSLLHNKHKDWKLVIVGGGEELTRIKEYANSLCLTNVYFEGFQDPVSYYKKASIFCMTSASEGFGIVLVEAMNMGVVPVAFDSFSAVRDIINDNVNGVLVSPFDVKLYSEKLSNLIVDKEKRLFLSNKANEKSRDFHVNIIGDRWLVLFKSLFV